MMGSITTMLPGLDCGLCGSATCAEFDVRLAAAPELIKRCIHLDQGARADSTFGSVSAPGDGARPLAMPVEFKRPASAPGDTSRLYVDSLGREFDFVLQHFPEDPGPREIIIPHNPMLTREMNITRGDVMIGRPLGMSCGCPVTHCGVVTDVDQRTGVITWCVTGPLRPRQEGFKDIGYYIAEAYEGLVKSSRSEVKIGMRYFFQPDMCMLQWRHSGLVNYINRTHEGLQIRIEGLWIG
jgi:uncharacterized Fe-S cluster-containing protein